MHTNESVYVSNKRFRDMLDKYEHKNFLRDIYSWLSRIKSNYY